MALAHGKIHAGPARIFVGVTAATTGTPPTYTTHTDGVPGSGTEVGHTEGGAVFKYQAVKKEIASEQSLAAVDVFTESEMATLTFTCLEQTYNTLQQAFDNVGKETQSSGDAFWFGGGTGILAPTTQCVTLTSRQRNAPTKFIVTQLYKVYSVNGIELSFQKSGHTLYQVTLTALADLARNAGDQLGYYRFEK